MTEQIGYELVDHDAQRLEQKAKILLQELLVGHIESVYQDPHRFFGRGMSGPAGPWLAKMQIACGIVGMDFADVEKTISPFERSRLQSWARVVG